MKFSLFYFPQLGGGDPEAFERTHLGNDPEMFAYLLEDMKLQVQIADDAGFHGVYFAEHHFQCEGFQVSQNGLLFDTWVGMNTKRLKLGQLGLVLPAWNPLRLAEDIGMVAQMFPGRLELGFARGFQAREVGPLAAAHQVENAMSDYSEADQRNRRLFMENYEVLMKALRQDFIHHEGEFNTIPPKGVTWNNAASQKYGSGVTEDGVVTEISVVPKLPGREMPTRWQAFSGSEETIRWAGREGMNLAMLELKPSVQRQAQEAFREASAEAGRALAYGEGVGYLRGMLCLEDGEAAVAYDRASCDKLWGEWGHATGFSVAFQPEDFTDWANAKYDYDLVRESGYSLVGNADDVSRRLEKLLEETSCEHVFFQYNTGTVPRDVLIESLETFATKVMPRFAS